MVVVEAVSALIAVWICVTLLTGTPKPLLGHYSQKGGFFGIKRFLTKIYLKFFRKRGSLLPEYDRLSNIPSDFAFVATKAEAELENPRPLPRDKNALDSVQVFGMDEVGNSIIAKLVRRNDRCADVWLYIRLASGDEYQLPFQPEVRVYNTAPDTFSAAGLTFEVLEPLRRWKISFNGLLRKTIRTEWKNQTDADDNEIVHGRFNFIWCPIHAPFDSRRSFDYCDLDDSIANERWTPGFLFRKLRLPDTDWYDQWGQMQGTITIDKNETENLFLRGRKERKSGKCNLKFIHRYANIELYFKDGTTIHLKALSQKSGLTHTVTGYILHSRGTYEKISYTNFELHRLAEKGVLPKNIRLDIASESKKYLTVVTVEQAGFLAYLGHDWDAKVLVRKVTVTSDDSSGYGVLEMGYSNDTGCPLPPTASIPYLDDNTLSSADTNLLAVGLPDPRCCNSNVVGGKGMSLALMTSFLEGRFIVPKGLCVTVAAYWKFLAANPKIGNGIKQLQDVAWKNTEGDVKQECQRVVDLIAKTAIPVDIQTEVLKCLKEVFGDGYSDVKMAVRSSAIGEDGEETSAAGQNDTVLGVKGADHLWEALARCWASQFSFISVEYKRNNGQLLNGGMGVVVQEMVPADKAGVLFTRHPVTGNAGQMVITANYGLGESVVSSTVDPDMITLKRTWQNNLSIESTEIGNKAEQINLSGDSGTQQNKVSREMSMQCCLSVEEALRLGEIGIVLENAFGGPRDIEWAITGEQDYMLQSRAITTFERESDYLIAHELDSGFLTDDEILTKGNVGEVFPEATSPLALSTLGLLFDEISEKSNVKFNPLKAYPSFRRNFMYNSSNHVFLNILQMMAMGIGETLSKQTIGMGQSVLGYNFVDDYIKDLILRRHGITKFRNMFVHMIPALKEMFWSRFEKDCSRVKKTFTDDCIPVRPSDSSTEIYKKITKQFYKLREGFSVHYFISMASSVMNSIIFSILTSNVKAEDIGTKQDHDSSILYQSCYGVESAGVPTAIEEIVAAIAKGDQDWELFSKMSVQEAHQWLTNNKGRPGKLFKEFLVNHSHRCVKEFDFRSKPWGIDNLSIVKTFQDSFKNGVPKIRVKENTTVSQSLDKIETKLSSLSRRILWHVVNVARKTVGRRETAKSMIIFGVNTWRQAYEKMANQMVAEGRIPDADLIYFFTHNELGTLLKTRSARLLKKAQRRQKMHTSLNSLKFELLTFGQPKPIVRHDVNFAKRDPMMTLHATPTSSGIAEGTARVVLSVDDASQIQQGDILITYFTDIGWSPYFPRIKAVVTELGGVISHGTVVAREYGIPCLISAKMATNLFQSGDLVRVDGTLGTIQLLSQARVGDKHAET